MNPLVKELKKAKFVAILRRVPMEKILPCAEAAWTSGVKFLELTFDPADPETLPRTAAALASVRQHFPELHVGCGTVLNVRMAGAAADAGAEFIVSPVTDAAVIAAAHRFDMTAIPGAWTPGEILQAWDAGADIVKIFPVLPGGENYVNVVMAPLAHIPFMLTGGIHVKTIAPMLATGAVAVGAGAAIFPAELVAAGNFSAIAELIQLHLKEIAPHA